MSQSRIDSMMEVATNIVIGFVVNFVANWYILPAFFDITPDLATFTALGVAYTVVGVARMYVLRRLFNGKSPWTWLKGQFT